MAATNEVWAFSERADLLAEMIAGARNLAEHTGGAVAAVVLGARSEADAALSRGAQRVYWLGEQKEGYLVDDYVPTLVGLLKESTPAVLLVGATRHGRAVAGRAAVHFDTTVLTDVMDFSNEGGLQVRHMIFGGGAIRVDRPLSDLVIATAGPGVFEVSIQAGAEGEVVEVPFVEPQTRVRLVERKAREVAAVNLNAARRVVCAGRGLGKQEDLPLVEELARALGAELACTRPLAEGLDWLPRERYIGISGAMIKPDLYLGVGVSGQAQHVIGMNESRVVAAVNKDSSAPIFSQADYIIESDLYEFIPALIEILRGR